MYLNAHDQASVLDQLGEDGPVVAALVQGLVEEDHAADAAVDALVRGEEELAVAPAVFLSVFHTDGVEALCHAPCGRTHGTALCYAGMVLLGRTHTGVTDHMWISNTGEQLCP